MSMNRLKRCLTKDATDHRQWVDWYHAIMWAFIRGGWTPPGALDLIKLRPEELKRIYQMIRRVAGAPVHDRRRVTVTLKNLPRFDAMCQSHPSVFVEIDDEDGAWDKAA